MALKGKIVVAIFVTVSALCDGFKKKSGVGIMTPDDNQNVVPNNNMVGFITTSTTSTTMPLFTSSVFITPTQPPVQTTEDDTVIIENPTIGTEETIITTIAPSNSTILTTIEPEPVTTTTTEAPTTEALTTEVPTTEAPTTEVPTTEAPTTEAPTTEAPTTEAPTTEALVTEAPTEPAADTQKPDTQKPDTTEPITESSTAKPSIRSDLVNSFVNILNASFNGHIFGIQIPSDIKIVVEINSNPNITINVNNNAASTTEDAPIVEIIRVNGTNPGEIFVVTEKNNDKIEEMSTHNINLSGPMVSTTITTTSAPISNIYQDKCIEYYNRRTKRRTNVQVFIVGGSNSNPKEFPHMAALGYGKKTESKFLCGGSLISENYVITAAHCLSANDIGEIQYVRLGTTSLQTETLNSQDFNVLRRIPHPDYIPGQQYNDIALIQLDRPVNFSEYIAPVCLYGDESDVELQNTKLTATGWGRTQAAGSVSSELQKVDLDYFPSSLCREIYSTVSKEQLPQGINPTTQMCAGSYNDQKDTCQGDSGGPLQFSKEGRLYLVGITSFGVGCGKPGTPGVYTKVAHYIPWIQKVVWGQ